MGMGWYVARRLAWAVVVAYLIVSVTFVLIWLSPTAGLAEAQFGAAQRGGNATAVKEAIETRRGLDEPVWKRFSDYIVGLTTGNWGWSDTRSQWVLGIEGNLVGQSWDCATGYRLDQRTAACGQAATTAGTALTYLQEGKILTDDEPDDEGEQAFVPAVLPRFYGAIPDALPYTMMYSAPSVLFSTVVGLAIGLYSAVNQYTKTDYAATFAAFFGISIPNFWFGIVLLMLFGVGMTIELGGFSVQTGWLPVVFDGDLAINRTFSVANVKQLILPVFVLTTGAIAGNMRYGRAEALEYVNAEFVKTAKAKGATGRRIVLRHIFRPALVPLSTILVGDLLGFLIAASYLVEIVFGIPGLGRLAVDAILNTDTAVVLGTTFIPVFIGVIGNLMQDLAYTVFDPRIDYGDR